MTPAEPTALDAARTVYIAALAAYFAARDVYLAAYGATQSDAACITLVAATSEFDGAARSLELARCAALLASPPA